MKIITLLIYLFSFNLALASEDSFITTEVYKYPSKNGTPIFTDKKPKNKTHQTQIVEAVKSTGNGDHETALMARDHIKVSGKSRKKAKKKKTVSIATCKLYKKRLDAVSEKMRVGYKAEKYRKLEKKRVKYRDLLFNKCNRHDLL